MRARLLQMLCACVCAFELAVQAQAPAPQQATGAGQTAVRVTTRLVEVNVVVHEKHGQPVSDLSKEDFVVLDQGQPEAISVFSVQTNQPRTAPAAPLPTNTFTNRFEQRPGVPASVTIILLDSLNTRLQDQAYARDQVIKFLEQLQPQDRVALYALGSRLMILHDFTTDASRLLAALQRYRGRVAAELEASEPEDPNTGNADLDQFFSDANQRMAVFYTTYQRVRPTLAGFEAIADRLAGLPGRKNLIWVSSSFPISIGYDQIPTPDSLPAEQRSYADDIDRAVRLVNSANIAIYPVDARGLMGPLVSASTRRSPTMSPRARRMIGGPASLLNPSRANIDTMEQLADRTGGRAFFNTNDIQGAIRRAIDDSRVTYTLGFYPTHNKWDGKFHDIKVEVKRPGLNVRARRGYFAVAEASRDPKQSEAELREVATGPLEATGIGLTVQVETSELPGDTSLNTKINISPQDLRLELRNGRWMGTTDFLFVQLDGEGKLRNALRETLNMALQQATYQEAQEEGFHFSKQLQIVGGATRLRVVVHDAVSGTIGSLTIPLAKIFPAR